MGTLKPIDKMTALKRKFVIMGFRAVGKSSISIRFVENHYVDSYSPTIENTYLQTVQARGREYECEVIDTSGQDEFSIFQNQYALGIHGYILVFCVNNRHSFDVVQVIHDKILNAVGADHVPCVLVGNKSDLDEDRVISVEQGEALAKEWGCQFVECSAKLNDNIVSIFKMLIEEVDKEHAPPPEKKESLCVLQ